MATIEVGEHDLVVVIQQRDHEGQYINWGTKVYLGSKQLGLISDISLRILSNDLLPRVRIALANTLSKESFAGASDSVKESIRDTASRLHDLLFVSYSTPEVTVDRDYMGG